MLSLPILFNLILLQPYEIGAITIIPTLEVRRLRLHNVKTTRLWNRGIAIEAPGADASSQIS